MTGTMKNTRTFKIALTLYGILWSLAIPVLYLFPRIRCGFKERLYKTGSEINSNIWIQAASAGEAYIAIEIIRNLKPEKKTRIHLTSYTSQGLEILNNAFFKSTCELSDNVSITTGFFPFDSPQIIKRAVRSINPEIMILIESEMWPGLMYALKKNGTRVFIINGRLTEKSFRNYIRFTRFWENIAPNKILAISEDDARRFSRLFKKKVELLPNIKFDSITNNISILNEDQGNIRLHKDNKLLVLASVRKEEEEQVSRIIEKIFLEIPDTVIALFPRHMHRIKKWQKILTRLNCNWTLKSKTEMEILPGTVILWDRFGELTSVYNKADAAFVGGSLAGLGGQNFIEPISSGIIPVIGPYWDDFSWIGKEIFRNGLAIEGKNWQETAESLIRILQNPENKTTVISNAWDYFHKKRGGSAIACKVILEAMQ